MNREKSIGNNANFDDIPATHDTAVDYCKAHEEKDPFPDASNLNPLDYEQKDDTEHLFSGMLQLVDENGLPLEKKCELRHLIVSDINSFRPEFLSGSLAKVMPLKYLLTDDAKPFRVHVSSCSQELREFLVRFLLSLVNVDIAYFNPLAV